MGKIKNIIDQYRGRLSYDKLAHAAGMNHVTLYNIMDRDDLKYSQAQALAKVLNISVATFFGLSEEKNESHKEKNDTWSALRIIDELGAELPDHSGRINVVKNEFIKLMNRNDELMDKIITMVDVIRVKH